MIGRIVIEVEEENRVVVFISSIEPYDSIRILIATALSMLEGRAEVQFVEGSEGGTFQTGGQRDN